MNQYEIHFEGKVLEIGGGNRPLFHPNVDIRKVDGVDIVCDVGEEPLPIESETYNGILGLYCIEHISFRLLRAFISECYRVLKKNGKLVFLTSNTLEQCRRIVEAGDKEFNDDMSCMLFGGQGGEGIEAGSHKAGFSPSYITRLFKEAGFRKVNVYELPNIFFNGRGLYPTSSTDLLIEVIK